MRFHLTVAMVCVGLMAGCSLSSRSKSAHFGFVKPVAKGTWKPYAVQGRRYVPTTVHKGQKMRGIASWYGPKFHGKLTSNAERYDMHAFTAAHKTWPMNTMVRVTNLRNGRSVVVRINDRGPFVLGRVIDCSYAAGKQIGLDKSGLAPVELEVLGSYGTLDISSQATKHASKSDAWLPKGETQSPYGVQLGVFRHKEGAEIFRKKVLERFPDRSVHVAQSGIGINKVYRVYIDGFSDKLEAKQFVLRHRLVGAFVIETKGEI